jgi:hypothetical protein
MLARAVAGHHGAAASTAFEEVFSVSDDRPSTAANPWDKSITVPDGDNRVLIALGFAQDTLPALALDPAGDDIAWENIADSTESGDRTWAFKLLETALPATGAKIQRATFSGTKAGLSQIIGLHGASQTVYADQNSSAVSGDTLAVSVTRPSGNFPVGSKVYSVGHSASATDLTVTITDDATEDREIFVTPTNDNVAYAAGALGSEQSTVTATFTWSATSPRRTGVIVVVEPA